MPAVPCPEPPLPTLEDTAREFPYMLMVPVPLNPVLWAGWKCWEFMFPGAIFSQRGAGVENADLSFIISQCDNSDVYSAPVGHSGSPPIYTVLTGFPPILTPLRVF